MILERPRNPAIREAQGRSPADFRVETTSLKVHT
jgi:hypothetical protein